LEFVEGIGANGFWPTNSQLGFFSTIAVASASHGCKPQFALGCVDFGCDFTSAQFVDPSGLQPRRGGSLDPGIDLESLNNVGADRARALAKYYRAQAQIVLPLAAPASLKLDVIAKPSIDGRTGTSKIKWVPQNVDKGGFVIQHAITYLEYKKAVGGNVIKEKIADFWEAWEVDAKGVVHIGYIKDNNGKHNADTFDRDIPDAKSSGFMEVIGYARYTEKFTPDWAAGGVPDSGALPSTKKMPMGWTDANTIKQGFKITWDDFKCEAPKIVESWP
jgi:hypothetical protein